MVARVQPRYSIFLQGCWILDGWFKQLDQSSDVISAWLAEVAGPRRCRDRARAPSVDPIEPHPDPASRYEPGPARPGSALTADRPRDSAGATPRHRRASESPAIRVPDRAAPSLENRTPRY